jgi:hypothetical protein
MFEKKIQDEEVTKVISALSEVIDFISGTTEKYWENALTEIRNRLIQKSERKKALETLENCFGGMGTLNEISFRETNKTLPKGAFEKDFNTTWNKLLDILFKELRLVGASSKERDEWEKLEEECFNEPPPRIKKPFRSRTQSKNKIFGL